MVAIAVERKHRVYIWKTWGRPLHAWTPPSCSSALQCYLFWCLDLHGNQDGDHHCGILLTVKVVSLFCFRVGDGDPGLWGERQEASSKLHSTSDMVCILRRDSVLHASQIWGTFSALPASLASSHVQRCHRTDRWTLAWETPARCSRSSTRAMYSKIIQPKHGDTSPSNQCLA